MRCRARSLLVVTATAGLALVACGDDGDATDVTETTETTGAPATTGAPDASDVPEAFCQARVDLEVALETEDAEAAAAGLDALEANAPESIAEEVSILTSRLREDPEAALEFPEVIDAKAAIDAEVIDGCGFDAFEVTAIDYQFEGMPRTVDAGTMVLRLTNDGAELHEMAVAQINDGVTESGEELFSLPEAELESRVTFRAGAFAAPGGTDTTVPTLEPGQYALVCLIPVGTRPDVSGTGPPHYLQGMFSEFTVS